MHHPSPAQRNDMAMQRIAASARAWGKVAAIPALLALTTACSTTAGQGELLSVEQLIEGQSDYIGSRQRIYGFMPYCHALSCGLTGNEEERVNSRWLSIEASDVFDAAAARFEGRWVEIEADVTSSCFPPRNPDHIVVCADRPSTLRNARLVRAY